MNKEQLLTLMRSNGKWMRYNADDPEWRRMFDLARANGLEYVEHGCGKCLTKVIEWAERV